MKRKAAILGALLMFTGVSSAEAKPNIHQDFKFMADFTKALAGNGIKCAYTKNDGVAMVREEGVCKWKGQDLTLDLFANNKTGKAVIPLIQMMGGYYFFEHNWSIQVEGPDTAKAIGKLLRSKVN